MLGDHIESVHNNEEVRPYCTKRQRTFRAGAGTSDISSVEQFDYSSNIGSSGALYQEINTVEITSTKSLFRGKKDV